jgi:translation initiation factor 2 beta subunit (eIF-2beta)/eIF-5
MSASSNSKLVNIGGGHEDDAFYRYKREVVKVRTEHKHGIQTRLLNLFSIAKQLHLKDVQHLVKDIKKTLGANITVDPNSQTCVIQTLVPVDKLEFAINKYIEQHVLCRKCRLPELRDDICLACGTSQTVNQRNRSSTTNDESELLTISDLTEKSRVKYDKAFERVCCQTITDMLNWHDKHKHDSKYRTHWESRLDELRTACWTCESEYEAGVRARRWKKLKSALDEEAEDDTGIITIAEAPSLHPSNPLVSSYPVVDPPCLER